MIGFKQLAWKRVGKAVVIGLGLCVAITFAYAGSTVINPGQSAFAQTSEEVSRVVADNGDEQTTYYVRTDKSESKLKSEIKETIKDSDSRVTDVRFDADDDLDVYSTGSKHAAIAASGVKVYSEKSFCKHVVDDQALDTTVDYSVSKSTSIPYKTVTRKSSAMRKTTKKITGGVKGKVVRKYTLTKRNGETTDKTLVSTKTTSPKTKVITKGTGSVTVGSGRTFSGTSGKQIANYALKFVGNPYRYGGISLTNGTDCSGFVYSVYRHFGLNVARIPTYSGKRVSLSNLKAGDIILYPGHFSMYIGNGKVVHAINYQYGIRVTSLNWGKTARSARRIVR